MMTLIYTYNYASQNSELPYLPEYMSQFQHQIIIAGEKIGGVTYTLNA